MTHALDFGTWVVDVETPQCCQTVRYYGFRNSLEGALLKVTHEGRETIINLSHPTIRGAYFEARR